MPAVELQVMVEDEGARLDAVLARRVPELSRARAKILIEQGAVRVNDRPAKKSHLVTCGDRITIDEKPGSADFHAAPAPDLQIDVLLQTDDYVVVGWSLYGAVALRFVAAP